MVKLQAGILESDPVPTAEEKLRAAVSDLIDSGDALWVETQLRPLLGLGADGDTSGVRREEAFVAWRRFFEAMAERHPLVLIFEDLHWADDALLDFVDEMVDWASGVPMLVLVTARPEQRRHDLPLATFGGGDHAARPRPDAPLRSAR
jgi:hypothetical protein